MLVSVTVYVRVQGNPNGLCAVDIYQTRVKKLLIIAHLTERIEDDAQKCSHIIQLWHSNLKGL